MTGSVPQVLKFANDFLPAVPTSVVSYRANLASYPLTTKHDNSIPGSELLQPADFASGNPRSLGTPATPYGDATTTGASKNNKATTPAQISSSTLLNGAANTDSLTTNFVLGDTITVDGTPITIVNTATNLATNEINLTTGTIGDLLANIGAITGVTPTISGGAITLHTGTASTLTVATSNTTALGAMGLAPLTLPRTGGGTAGTGQVLGGDLQAFVNESISGGAVTAYDISGSPVNLQLRWAKVDSSSLGAGHTDTWNMFYQVELQRHRHRCRLAERRHRLHLLAERPDDAGDRRHHPDGADHRRRAARQHPDQLRRRRRHPVRRCQRQCEGQPDPAERLSGRSLQTVAISQNGRVVGNYSNGRNIDLAEISVATFNGTNSLKRIDGGAFEATDQSGPALFGSGGTIVGSSLEGSNTDIADEFTKLIVTQQAYSANTKVITTSNSMVQDLLNMLR